jgi:hypothetical protein
MGNAVAGLATEAVAWLAAEAVAGLAARTLAEAKQMRRRGRL